jgi:alpha-glucosidase
MKPNTASENVHLLDNQFYIPQLNRHRAIYIYLPPDYHNSEKRYPVLYMQDGQNLFNEALAYGREWKVDKALNQLHQKKDCGSIVVGIANGGEHRIHEYAPWVRGRMGGGEGDKYLDFLTDTLKPSIDKNFRTLTDPQNTAIVGSSMGGLLAMYGILRRRDIFGKAGVLSPSFWFNSKIYEFAEKNIAPDSKIYIAGSKTESRFMQSNLEGMYWALRRGGLPDLRLRVVLKDRGKHNEIFWSKTFKEMYAWLK